MRYWIATFGPIEVGRVTDLNGEYFVTVNAVAAKCPQAGVCAPQPKPETAFIKTFTDFYAARDYAISFFDPRTQNFIQWTEYD